ncbi:MAG: hypothetical protein WCJ64_02005 [Rhodospirillaceae bacterium]
MSDKSTTPTKPAPPTGPAPFRPRMLTETEIEALKEKQREMSALWPDVKYLP